MKSRMILLIAATAVISAAVTYGLTRGRLPVNGVSAAKPADSHAEEAEHGHAIEIPDLRTEPAVAGEGWDVITATGKVGPNINKVVKIGSRIAGKVVSVRANLGDVVRRGQVLASISSVELAQARAVYRQSAARLNAARDAYQRQAKLAALGAFTKRPAEEARAEHTAAQGELAQSQAELAQSESELVRAESELAQCRAKLGRARELYKDEIVSRQDLEAAEAEYKRDQADVEAAKSKIRQSEAKVKQAAAQVKIAKSYLDREERVLSGDLLAQKELQAAKAEVTSAEVALGAAADTIRVLGASPAGSGDVVGIVSPISGRVVERSVNLGEMAEPSDTLFTVMNLSDVWVEANVYEKDLAAVRTGQAAEVRVDAFPDTVFPGRVTYIGDVLDPQSRTAQVRCSVANADGRLKPEMFASITIITARREGAVLVAKHAVLDDAGKKIVFVPCTDCPEDVKAGESVCGTFDKREVTLGPAHGDTVEVMRGIEHGEEIVTAGHYQLKSALGAGTLEAGCADH